MNGRHLFYCRRHRRRSIGGLGLVTAIVLTAVLLQPTQIYPDDCQKGTYIISAKKTSSRQAAPERIMTMEVTAYTTSIEDCGKTDGITASGTIAGPGTVGSDWSVLPPGTRVEVPGYGVGTIEDRGDGARGNRLDVWLPSRGECFAWGRQRLEVRVLE